MEKNTRILIGAILILFIAMISFRFETLTGAVVEKDFESTASFDIQPIILDAPGEKIYGKIKTQVEIIKPINGEPIVYGKSYIDIDKGICILEKPSNVRRLCILLHCSKEDARGGCIEAEFDLRTNTLNYGKDFVLRFWEYEKLGSRGLGKYIEGGRFTIQSEIKKLPHENIYDIGKITV